MSSSKIVFMKSVIKKAFSCNLLKVISTHRSGFVTVHEEEIVGTTVYQFELNTVGIFAGIRLEFLHTITRNIA
ncbi:hypothetical protein D3C73_1407960 [compost metagenome]